MWPACTLPAAPQQPGLSAAPCSSCRRRSRGRAGGRLLAARLDLSGGGPRRNRRLFVHLEGRRPLAAARQAAKGARQGAGPGGAGGEDGAVVPCLLRSAALVRCSRGVGLLRPGSRAVCTLTQLPAPPSRPAHPDASAGGRRGAGGGQGRARLRRVLRPGRPAHPAGPRRGAQRALQAGTLLRPHARRRQVAVCRGGGRQGAAGRAASLCGRGLGCAAAPGWVGGWAWQRLGNPARSARWHAGVVQ